MLEDLLIPGDLIEAQEKKHEKSSVEAPLEYGLNIYTDGGCVLGNPALGIPNLSGYGIHSFLFVNTPTKTGSGINGYTTTDRGYILNSHVTRCIKAANIYKPEEGISALGVSQVQVLAYLDGYGSLCDATNNVAEATAFLKSLDIVERAYNQLKVKTVHFGIDSEYVIKNVLTRFELIQNNYINKTGKELANKDLWIEIFARLEELSQLDIVWTVEWIKGHSDNFGNIQADRLATIGRVAATNYHFFDELRVYPAQGHWSKNNTVDFKDQPAYYFLADTKWYYDPTMEFEKRSDDLHPIFVGIHDDVERIGQPNGDVNVAIALVKEPPKHLTALAEIATKLDRVDKGLEVNGMFFGNMNNLLKPEIEEQVTSHADKFMITNMHKKQIVSYDKKEIITRLDPPYVSRKQMERFQAIHDVIDRVIDNKLLKHEKLTEVTDHFYDVKVDAKGKKTVKLNIGNEAATKVDVGVIKYNADYVYEECIYDVTLTYGITAPRRRVFSGIKDNDPKVFVLTSYEAHIGFRYYTIIQLPSGEYGIWTNPHANCRYF